MGDVPEDKVDEFKKNFPAFYKGVRKGTKGCNYYGFARCGNKFFCHESYKDGESALQHLEDVGEAFGKAIEIAGGPPKVLLMGPKAELDKCKEKFDAFNTEYWETDERAVWFGTKGGKSGKPDTHINICPTFDVPAGKMDAFKAKFDDFMSATKSGTKECLYYGFCISGNKVFCREGYKSSRGCLQHLKDVAEE